VVIVLLRQHTGRDELRLDPGAICATWRLGSIRWRKTVQRSKVAQFTVVRRMGARREYYALVAEYETGRRRTLVSNYPREMLLALAAELSSRWKGLGIDPDFDAFVKAKLAVGEDTEIPTDIRERIHPPRGTRLGLERVGKNGVRIIKPPSSLSSTVPVVFVILGVASLLWAINRAVLAILRMNAGDAPINLLLTWVDVGFGVFVGVIFIASAVRLAVLTCVLTATPDSLTLMTRGFWKTSRRSWQTPEIASIHVHTEYMGRHHDHPPDFITRLLIRTTYTGGPVFLVPKAGADAVVLLRRKPKGAPASAYALVGQRTGPGPIGDESPISDGEYDYAVQQKTPAGGLGPMGPTLSGRVGPVWDELISHQSGLSKPEMEWIATTLRGVLGVPVSLGPTDDVTRVESGIPRFGH
jgi:hypothetical protein